MTTRNVTAIALRLFALWLLVQVITNVPGLVMLLTTLEQYQGQAIARYLHVLLIASCSAIGLLAAYLIWRAAGSALKHSCDTKHEQLGLDGQRFLLQLGGICFVVFALASLPRSLAALAHAQAFSYTTLLWPAGLVFQLLAGLALVVGASRWVALLSRLRARG